MLLNPPRKRAEATEVAYLESLANADDVNTVKSCISQIDSHSDRLRELMTPFLINPLTDGSPDPTYEDVDPEHHLFLDGINHQLKRAQTQLAEARSRIAARKIRDQEHP